MNSFQKSCEKSADARKNEQALQQTSFRVLYLRLFDLPEDERIMLSPVPKIAQSAEMGTELDVALARFQENFELGAALGAFFDGLPPVGDYVELLRSNERRKLFNDLLQTHGRLRPASSTPKTPATEKIMSRQRKNRMLLLQFIRERAARHQKVSGQGHDASTTHDLEKTPVGVEVGARFAALRLAVHWCDGDGKLEEQVSSLEKQAMQIADEYWAEDSENPNFGHDGRPKTPKLFLLRLNRFLMVLQRVAPQQPIDEETVDEHQPSTSPAALDQGKQFLQLLRHIRQTYLLRDWASSKVSSYVNVSMWSTH